jgi:hypothetical protein
VKDGEVRLGYSYSAWGTFNVHSEDVYFLSYKNNRFENLMGLYLKMPDEESILFFTNSGYKAKDQTLHVFNLRTEKDITIFIEKCDWYINKHTTIDTNLLPGKIKIIKDYIGREEILLLDFERKKRISEEVIHYYENKMIRKRMLKTYDFNKNEILEYFAEFYDRNGTLINSCKSKKFPQEEWFAEKERFRNSTP